MSKRIPIFENWEFNNYDFLPSQTAEVEIIESNGKKLKEGVLGIVKGPSFFGDSFSRNGRFYPKELWYNALKNPEFQRNLKRGLIFSCIGHPENYTLDELLASGAVAAKVKDIEYDGKVGNVTYEILDTPAGRILNTILRSGSRPYVSTRAFGSFLNETKDWNGRKVPVLNPNDFYLESIDFVINPGFLETDPQLVESLEQDIKKLQESGIKCKDGICELKINETTNTEDVLIDREKLEHLDKFQLIKLIEDLKRENLYLIREAETANSIQLNLIKNSDEKDLENFKYLKPFIAFLEMLLKLIKYNTKYEEDYENIIKKIDTSKISLDNIQPIEELCKKIEEDEVDESLKEIANYLLIIINANKGETNKKDVEEAIAEYVYRYWDLMQEINVLKESVKDLTKEANIYRETSETLSEKLIRLQKAYSEKLNKSKEELETLKEDMKKQIRDLKEELEKYKSDKKVLEKENKTLKENLEELETQLKEEKENREIIEKAFEKKLEEIQENKVKIIEEKQELKQEILSLKEELKALKEEKQELVEKLNNIEKEKKSLLEDLESKQKVIEKLNNNENKLKEELEALRKAPKITEQKQDKKILEKLNTLKEDLKETKIKYYQEKFKIDSGVVKTLFEKYDGNEALIEKELKMLQKKTLQEKLMIGQGFDLKITEEKRQNPKINKLEKLLQ